LYVQQADISLNTNSKLNEKTIRVNKHNNVKTVNEMKLMRFMKKKKEPGKLMDFHPLNLYNTCTNPPKRV